MRIIAAINSRAFAIRSLVLFGLFVQGLLLGSLCIAWTHSEPSVLKTENPISYPDAVGPSVSLPVAEPILEQKRLLGERLLLNGEPYEALRYLLFVKQQLAGAADDWLHFEIATCYEAANDVATAREYYSLIGEGSTLADRDLVAAAQIAMARTASKDGDFQFALQILWKKIFSISSRHDELFYGDIVHLTGQVLSQQFTSDSSKSMLDPDYLLAYPDEFRPELEIKKLLELKQASSEGTGEQTTGQEGPEPPQMRIENLVQVNLNAGAIVFDIESREVTLLTLLQLLGESTEISFQLTDLAASSIRGNYVSLSGKSVSLAMLLDRMTIPNELYWQQLDSNITIGHTRELQEQQSRSLQIDTARRFLSKAILEFPEHPTVNCSKFNLSVIGVRQGSYESSIQEFQDLLEMTSNPVARQSCFFNLAKTYQAAGLDDLSLDSMQKVIDSSSVGNTLTTAYLELGRIQLENGYLDDSIQSFSRAVQVSNNRQLVQIGTINLTSAYLMNGQPRNAKQVMIRNSQRFDQDQTGQLAQYLAALAAYQISIANSEFNSDDPENNQQIINLMGALPQVQPIDNVGSYQYVLIAKGWAEIGSSSEVEIVANNGFQFPMGIYMRDELAFLLALSKIKENKLEEARKIFASLDYIQTRPKSLNRLFDWAELEFHLGDLNQCEHLCRELAKFELSNPLLAKTFNLLGHIHRKKGEHRMATLYFAGFQPE